MNLTHKIKKTGQKVALMQSTLTKDGKTLAYVHVLAPFNINEKRCKKVKTNPWHSLNVRATNLARLGES